MTKYPGFEEYNGKNGRYKVNREQGESTIEVFLRSVSSFVRERNEWKLSNIAERSDPDVLFRVEINDGYWNVVSMEVTSFCMGGVNEFVSELTSTQRDLSQPDELLVVMQELLDQPDAAWGELPIDLEVEMSVLKIGDKETQHIPGI
jgi:hypothetical protein